MRDVPEVHDFFLPLYETKIHVNLAQPSCDTNFSRVPFFLNLPMQNAVRANILNLINSETDEYVEKKVETHSMQYKRITFLTKKSA